MMMVMVMMRKGKLMKSEMIFIEKSIYILFFKNVQDIKILKNS